jgi:outer membrane protein
MTGRLYALSIPFVLVLFLFTPTISSAQQNKIGYIDLERIRQTYQGFRDAESEFQKAAKAIQDEVQTRQQQVELAQQQHEARKTMLTPERRQTDEEKIVREEQDLLQYIQSSQIQLAQQETELTRPLQETIFNVVETIAKEESFTYIFDSTTLVYVDPLRSQDLTSRVLEELQKEVK